MATSKAQQKAVNTYIKNNYDSLRITVPKGQKAAIEAAAKAAGDEYINSYVNRLIRADMGLSEDEWKGAGKKEATHKANAGE